VRVARLLRAILNTAVTEDELIIVNPCRIRGASEERATERPVLTLDQLYAVRQKRCLIGANLAQSVTRDQTPAR
jgi:hypothetical protein